MEAFGVGLQDKWPWPAVIVIGFGFVGLQVVAIPTIAITYAIDCYKPISGEIMAIATVCKNTFGVSLHSNHGFGPPHASYTAHSANLKICSLE